MDKVSRMCFARKWKLCEVVHLFQNRGAASRVKGGISQSQKKHMDDEARA